MKRARQINPIGLRLPDDLKSKLSAAAEASGRSLNAEIVFRLQGSFSEAATAARLAALEDALRKKGLIAPNDLFGV